MDKFDVNWTCRKCGAENCDSFAATAMPYCESCQSEYFWDDLLTPAHMYDLNKEWQMVLEEGRQPPEHEQPYHR